VSGPPRIVAHRGNGLGARENTLAAARAVVADGRFGLEIDVRLTADGAVVVHHAPALDPRFTRVADGPALSKPVAIAGLTLAELGRFEIRSDTAPGADRWESVPTLDDLLAVWTAAASDLPLLIELKAAPETRDALAQAVVEQVAAAGPGPAWRLMSFDWVCLAQARRLARHILALGLTPPAGRSKPGEFDPATGSAAEAIGAAGSAGWAAWYADLDAAALASARALGLEVAAWTVDDPDEMARLMALGIDLLITNHPELARSVAIKRGERR
jgi:glycerophosphoryl diester phosphodiesterase